MGAEQYGNGLYGTRLFDTLGRLQGKWICVRTTALGCDVNDGVNRHVEGYVRFMSGNLVTRLVNVMGDNSFGYDDLGRLATSTPTGSGTPQLTWLFDRYGNRLNQHDIQGIGLPHVDLWYDQSKNQIVGYNQPSTPWVSYDKAGNMTADVSHTYLYDQEGNLRCVDGCTKGSNLYDAFDRRVFHHMHQYSDKVERYEYNEDGQISDVWCNEDQYECQSRYYANGENFAYWLNGSMHFQHNDYLGTVHARTYDTGAPPGNPDIAREGTYYSLPWGDGKRYASGTQTPGGTDDSNAHFAELEHDQLDINSDTDQALNRTYVAAQGSWLQPDPYDGSYDDSDPQSFNRYSYVLNNPLMFSDPEGKQCGVAVPTPTGIAVSCISTVIGSTICGPACGFVVGGVVSGLAALGQALGLWAHPQCNSCVIPRPQAPQQVSSQTCQAGPMNLSENIKTAKSLTRQFWSGLISSSPGGLASAAGAAGYYVGLIQTGGLWDPKNWSGIPNSPRFPSYTAAGNINFGATCSQFGFNTWLGGQVCQYGAGINGKLRGDYGSSLRSKYHGDIPSDNQQIQQGLKIAQKGKC